MMNVLIYEYIKYALMTYQMFILILISNIVY
jgi:hypothetical protein